MAQTQILLKVALNTITLTHKLCQLTNVLSTIHCFTGLLFFFIVTWQLMENDNAMIHCIIDLIFFKQKKYLNLIFCQNLQNF